MTYVRRVLLSVAASLVAVAAAAPAGATCPGDCDGNNQVSVSELVTGVNIALGTQPLAVCPAMDSNGDGAVYVNEIVLAVDSSLTDCPDPCGGTGECTPGATRVDMCGYCGQQAFVCDATCRWRENGGCANPGECDPQMQEERSCGTCGTQSRTCNASCQWDGYGTCSNQGGECTPNATQEISCGGHAQNKKRRTCTNSCGWPAFGPCSCPLGVPVFFQQCSPCASDYHVAEVFGPTCGGGPGALRSQTCAPNCGPFFDACGTTCPSGYHTIRPYYTTGRCAYNFYDPGYAVTCVLN